MATKREELYAMVAAGDLPELLAQSVRFVDSGARRGGQNAGGCLAKAALDEPLFVLRAKDPLAPLAVRIWVQAAVNTGLHDAEEARAAIRLAEAMEAWRNAHFPPVIWTPPEWPFDTAALPELRKLLDGEY